MSGDIASLYIKVDSKGVVTASKDLDELTGKAQKTEDSTRKVTRATDSANASFMQMAKAVKALAVSYGALKVLQYVKEATMLAARYEMLGVTMRVAGNTAGYTGAQMEKAAQGMQKMGISMIASRENAMKMVVAQLDLAKAADLARVAQDVARVANINSSEAFTRMIQGIRSGEVEIFKTMGLMINMDKAYRDFEKTNNLVKGSIDAGQRAQAVMNAVLIEGEKYAGLYAATMDTAAGQTLSMQRHVENLKVAFGLAFTPALAEIIEQITGAVKDLNGELSGNSKDKITEWGTNFRIAIISVEAEVRRLAMLLDKLGGTMTSAQMLLYGPGKALGVKSSTERFDRAAAANMEYEARYKASEAALEALAKKQIELERSLTAEGKAAAKAKADAAESKVLAAQKATTATEKMVAADEKAIKATQKLREEWAKLKAELDFEKATAGMDDLDKALAEIERDMEKMRSNPNADLKLIDEIELQRQSTAIKAWYDEYLQEQIKAKENFDRQEKAKQDSIAKGERETLDAIQKQYDADGQLLRDKLELYKDLEGFEDEYRQVQLEWIERIKNENIKATGDVLAAEEKAAKDKTRIEYDLLRVKLNSISEGFGSLSSSFREMSDIYDEGSSAAMRWQEAAKAMEIAQKAVAVVNAVAAVAAASAAPFPAGFVSGAAMLASMASLLASIGASIGGGGGSSVKSAPSYAFSSSVLGGEAGAESESLKKSWEYLEDTYDMEYEKLTKIHNELKDLNDNITGLVTSIIRTGSVGAGFTLPSGGPGSAESLVNKLSESGIMSLFMGGSNFSGSIASTINTVRAIGLDFGSLIVEKFVPGLLGSLVSGIFGGGTEYWSGASGIGIGGGSAGGFQQGGGTSGYTWQDMYSKKDGGWFSSDEYRSWRQTAGLDAGVVELFSKVYKNLSDTLVELTIGLGQDVTKTLAYVFPGGTLALNGLSAAQISETLTNYFSAQADAAVQTLFGTLLKGYQEVGESLMDTAVRLMVDKEIVLEVLAQTNQAYSGSTANAIALSEALIKLAGDLETLTDIASTYYDKFFSEEEKHVRLQEQLTTILGALNIALPDTREAYRSIVESLDLTTTSGQTAYITLLKLAESADTYYSTLEDMADELTETAKALKAAFTSTNDAISEQISLAGAAASAARSAANEYRNIIKSLTDAQESIRGGGLIELTERFEKLFTIAMTGDREALSALPGAADKLLAGSLASSRTALDYARDQGKMLLALEEAKTVSGVSANWQDYQATLLETQVNVLEQIRDELQKESPDLALLEQHAGLLEDIATLLGGQTSEIITGNATQDAIKNIQNLNTSYSEEMLNALISGETTQTSSLEGILTATTTTVGLIRQLVDLSTANEKEKFMAKITSMQSTLDTVAGGVLTAQNTVSLRQSEIEPIRASVSSGAFTQAKSEAEAARQVYQNIVAGESRHFDYFYWTPEDYSSGTQFEGHGYQTNNWEVFGRHQAAWSSYTKEFNEARALMNYSAPDTDPTVSAAIQRKNAAENQLNIARGDLLDAQDSLNLLVQQYQDAFGERPPGYASGGSFVGGLRLVGEQGPELEMTGPSHIVNASKTEAFMSSNADLLAEIKKLNAKVERLEAGNYQIAKHTQKTAKTLDKFDYDGVPVKAWNDTPITIVM